MIGPLPLGLCPRLITTKTAAQCASLFCGTWRRHCPFSHPHHCFNPTTERSSPTRLLWSAQRAQSGQHDFDQLCTHSGHRAPHTPPRSAHKTNGREAVLTVPHRGRVNEAHHFRSGEELEATLHRLCLASKPAAAKFPALGKQAPCRRMKDWHKLQARVFKEAAIQSGM